MASTVRWIRAFPLLIGVCVGCASVPPVPAPAPTIPPIPTGPATIVVGNTAAPQGCSCSLCGFLGLDKLGGGVCKVFDDLRNCLGTRFPGLEATPALTAISDPNNLKSTNPAVATAADVKAQEDAAPQKIKALRYLSKIGCINCYPDIEKAFLAGLDDCTEAVRFEAAEDLRDMVGCPCQHCRERSCCTPAIRKKLADMACGVNEKTKCWREYSARVRRVARLALEKCGCPPPEAQPQQTRPQEGPAKSDLPAAPQPQPSPAPAAN
jgi:hypothetical protein